MDGQTTLTSTTGTTHPNENNDKDPESKTIPDQESSMVNTNGTGNNNNEDPTTMNGNDDNDLNEDADKDDNARSSDKIGDNDNDNDDDDDDDDDDEMDDAYDDTDVNVSNLDPNETDNEVLIVADTTMVSETPTNATTTAAATTTTDNTIATGTATAAVSSAPYTRSQIPHWMNVSWSYTNVKRKTVATSNDDDNDIEFNDFDDDSNDDGNDDDDDDTSAVDDGDKNHHHYRRRIIKAIVTVDDNSIRNNNPIDGGDSDRKRKKDNDNDDDNGQVPMEGPTQQPQPQAQPQPTLFRFCIIGRTRITVRRGRIDVLGTVLDANHPTIQPSRNTRRSGKSNSGSMRNNNNINDSSEKEVEVCSPFWSSWITVEIDSTCLPCELVLSSIHRNVVEDDDDNDDNKIENMESSSTNIRHSPSDGMSQDNNRKRQKIDLDQPNDEQKDSNNMTTNVSSGEHAYVQQQFSSQKQPANIPKTLPCSFRIMRPTRPIVLPPSWRNSVNQIIDDFGNNCTNHQNDGDVSIKRDQQQEQDVSGRIISRVGTRHLEFFDEETEDGYEKVNANANHSTETGPSTEDKHVQVRPIQRSVCLLTGAKGVGKSTLLRYMTNRLLSEGSSSHTDNQGVERLYHRGVAILDIDVGQPELAPPGMISLAIVRTPLLHPPYWNLTNINKGNDNNEQVENVASVFFGATTSKVDPSRYLQGVAYLMTRYENYLYSHASSVIPGRSNCYNDPPLLVNCDGWVKGLGYEILASILQNVVKPTHVCQIVGPSKAQSFDLTSIIATTVTKRVFCRRQQAEAEEGEHDENHQETAQPLLYILDACTAMPEASLCRVPSYTIRNFRWAAYFLPFLTQIFDTWDKMQARDLQTGWIVAKQSAFQLEYSDEEDVSADPRYNYYGRNEDTTATKPRNEHSTASAENDIGDECILARALASERPYAVPFEAVECHLVGSEFSSLGSSQADHQRKCKIIQALNGTIVGLCTDVESLQSIGMGILRSVDWNKQILYILVPDSVSCRCSLSKVKHLVGGHLPLQMPLVFRGVYAESFLFHAVVKNEKDTSNGIILGSEPMKSRNNIGRRSFTNGR